MPDCCCPVCDTYLGPETKVDYLAKCHSCQHRFINLNGSKDYIPADAHKWKTKGKGQSRASIQTWRKK